jgi:hypothetical protein
MTNKHMNSKSSVIREMLIKTAELGVVAHACNPSIFRSLRQEDPEFKVSLGYTVSSRPAGLYSNTLSQKNKN